jgi:hypothetical protein
VLFLVHRFLSPWWRRRQVPPKRWFLQEPHGVTTQKTPFFVVTAVKTSNLTHGKSSGLSSNYAATYPRRSLPLWRPLWEPACPVTLGCARSASHTQTHVVSVQRYTFRWVNNSLISVAKLRARMVTALEVFYKIKCNIQLNRRSGGVKWQEECRLLRCDAVRLLQEPTFRRNLSPPSSLSSVMRRRLQLLVTSNAVNSSLIICTVMMEVILSFGTLVLKTAARRHIPEDGILHSRLREDLKSYTEWTDSTVLMTTHFTHRSPV